MEIRNEVKQKDQEVEKKKFVVRNAADVQRAKLDKLMKNPDKPVIIPAPSKNRDFSTAIPSFVRNVMGSSAGAGSGEFHVYRHLRRKEYARQKQIQEKSRSEQLDDAFQDRLENNRKAAEERTAKKRAKRLKKKAKLKPNRGKKPKQGVSLDELLESSSEESDEEENEEASAQGDDSTDTREKDSEIVKEQHEAEKMEDTAGKEINPSTKDNQTTVTDLSTENATQISSPQPKMEAQPKPVTDLKEPQNNEDMENQP
ncbi:PRKR-interacting protein 1 homolog [Anopheles moucheti]|uniref:PRKR-interacting protein 1 homolog n=1 Tax=Anopheles moucheti TaxID=186751 RepID=UPI0022F0FCE5|nr:PRKR-interacting protein 1 homolog [Anopheles moucheti]